MEIKQITNFDSKEFLQASTIYRNSFPPNETRSLEKTKSLLMQSNYQLFIAVENDVVGFALLYLFGDFALLDYMAITPKYQQRGIGTKLFCHIIDIMKKKTDCVKIILLEIQKEKSNGDNKKNRIDRIYFYKKLGTKLLIDNYFLPPYRGNEIEEMYLMALPLNQIDSISKKVLTRYIKEIYDRVYNYRKSDLLEKTISNISEEIELKEIQINPILKK